MSHHTVDSSYLRAIAESTDADPVKTLNQICDHARDNSKYYSVFLNGREEEFLSMIEVLEHFRPYPTPLQHSEAVV